MRCVFSSLTGIDPAVTSVASGPIEPMNFRAWTLLSDGGNIYQVRQSVNPLLERNGTPMTGPMKWLSCILLLSALFGAQAQTINAASCSSTDVQNALNS